MTSELHYRTDGSLSTAVGPDAISLMQASYLWQGLKLYAATSGKIIPTRGMTGTRMLAMAGSITGKKYKRGAQAQAAEDVKQWMNAMKASLPHIGPNGEAI